MSRLSPDDTLLLASANQGKLAELSVMLAPFGVALASIGEFYTGELAEDGTTFEENALQKAHFSTKLSNLPALADDSGFCVDALDGRPGVYSARWAGAKKDFLHAMNKVHAEMPEDADLSAHFVCVLAVAFPDGTEHCFRGEIHGKVSWPPRGFKGFGYDPIFIPEGETRTFGEMPPKEKDLISHRAKAFALFRQEMLPLND